MTDSELEKIDRLCAIHLMGWFWREQPNKGGLLHKAMMSEYYGWVRNDTDDYSTWDVVNKAWEPTRNIAQAWECLEKFDRSKEPSIRWEYDDNLWLICWWDDEGDDEVDNFITAETAPLAICLACLKAKGIEI